MWKIIYNLLTFCALPVFVVIGLTNTKMKKNFRGRLFPSTEGVQAAGACMIHGASIGEAIIAQSVADYLAANGGPDHFLFTTNTSYAREMLDTRQGGRTGRTVASMPFDLRFSVAKFLDYHRPSMILIVETEIWPNLIWEAGKRSVPIIILNGRISDSTLATYRRLSPFMRSALGGIDAVIAQSEEHGQRFVSIGMDPERVFVTGNIKYYRPAAEGRRDPSSREKIITFGSVKEKELEEIYTAIALLKKDLPGYRYFIAPRELHLAASIEKDLSNTLRIARYSKIKEGADDTAELVVVDTVGDLTGIYARSRAAFVGGSLAPYGGQNMLEPLFVGTPVLFGPFTENFRDIARAILDRKAGILVRNGADIHLAITNLIGDDTLYSSTQAAGFDIVAHQRHVMEETAGIIMDVLERKRT
jgi:3-deoxy-D-manno-octulosonic-acid transferase